MRFGVIGTAYWGREIHVPGLRKAGAEVVGVWGRTAAGTEAAAAQHGVRPFASLDDLLAACDAVTMAVPPDAQEGIALAAAAAGRPMIVEKPLARDVGAAERIRAAAGARDLAAQVFFMRRFVPVIAAAIEAERGHVWKRAEIRVHSDVMARESPYSGSIWRQEAGAALWDIAPHVLSVLIPMLGPVVALEAEPDRDGVSRFRTTHAGGAVADVSLTLHSPSDAVSNRYRFISDSRDIVLPEAPLDRVEAFSIAARTLMEGIAAGRRDFPCGLDLGVEVVRWLAEADRRRRAA